MWSFCNDPIGSECLPEFEMVPYDVYVWLWNNVFGCGIVLPFLKAELPGLTVEMPHLRVVWPTGLLSLASRFPCLAEVWPYVTVGLSSYA